MSRDAEAHVDVDADVIVVGAGAAGLACARRLVDAGLRARARGAVAAVRAGAHAARLQLVHGRPRASIALAAEAGLRLVPMGDRHLLCADAEADGDDITLRLPGGYDRLLQPLVPAGALALEAPRSLAAPVEDTLFRRRGGRVRGDERHRARRALLRAARGRGAPPRAIFCQARRGSRRAAGSGTLRG
jgi:glycine/D-amino acid oxidase-like deaminating enzyme